MNIIYMHTHDSGRYMEPYGYKMETPAIMDFGQQSTLFRNAYCAGPTCSPSRSALLTGMVPHSNGMIGLAHRGFKLNDDSQHLASFLRLNGYETILCGVQHEGKNTASLGYNKVLGNQGHGDLVNADRAANYILNNTDEKFFMSFGMFNTHRVFPESTVNPDYVTVPPTIPDTADNRLDFSQYITSMQIVDKCVAKIMEAVYKTGRDKDTLIIFTTDHGISYPYMKCNLYDTGIGVSLMIKYPGNPTAGKATDCMVSHLDIFPTICELNGIDKPNYLQGVSLLPVLTDNIPVRDEIYSEVTFHAAYEPKRCIRTDKFKLIKRFDTHLLPVPANIDASPSKTSLIKNGYLDTPVIREELYDLTADPYERVNLIGNDRYLTAYNELNSKLVKHMVDTDDVILKYPEGVPIPDGAYINPLSDIDPI